MSDRRRSDRPLPPAPHPGENGDSGGVPQQEDENNQHGNNSTEILMAPPESA